MTYCMNCGTKLTDGVRFCTGCGTPAPSDPATEVSPPQTEIKTEEAPPAPVQQQPVEAPVPPQPTPVYTAPVQTRQPQPVYAAPVQPAPQPVYAAPLAGQVETPPPAGSRYDPVSTGGFIGIFLLMLIPVVNFILLIVWACGGCRKVNQANLARAMLILMLIGAVLTLILGIVFWGLFAGLGGLDGIKDSVMDEVMKSAAE